MSNPSVEKKRRNRSAAECIGTRYGQDMADVSDNRYQPGRTGGVPVYTMFGGYVCCPAAGAKPPKGWNWKPDGEAFGRTVFFAETESSASPGGAT